MKKLLLALVVAVGALQMSGQENQIKRIPGVGSDPNQSQYTTYERGVWLAAEVLGGYSCHFSSHNMAVAEVDMTVGYRINEFFKLGVGTGVRRHAWQHDLRSGNLAWGMPIFATVRGNLMPGLYRRTVPYYGIEVGGSIKDGFMIRPSVGVRIGEPRQAFTLALSYMGQDIKSYSESREKSYRYTSFVCLRLGYEF